MTEFLLDPPIWAPVAIMAVGVALLVSGNRRQDKTLMRVGGTIAAAGVLLAVVGYVGQTPREWAMSQTRQFVDAYENDDWERLRQVLGPRTTMASYGNPDMIVAGARMSREGDLGVRDVMITGLEATQAQTSIVVVMSILSEQERTMGRPVSSTWQLEWIETADGWELQTITPTQLAGRDPEMILRVLPRVGQ